MQPHNLEPRCDLRGRVYHYSKKKISMEISSSPSTYQFLLRSTLNKENYLKNYAKRDVNPLIIVSQKNLDDENQAKAPQLDSMRGNEALSVHPHIYKSSHK